PFRSAPGPARTGLQARAASIARGSIPRPSFRSSNKRGRYTSACPSFEFRRLPSVYAEQKGDEISDDLIRGEKENRSQRHHDEHHDGGNRRLAAGRPSDLGSLRAHFLQKFERAESHRLF